MPQSLPSIQPGSLRPHTPPHALLRPSPCAMDFWALTFLRPPGPCVPSDWLGHAGCLSPYPRFSEYLSLSL